MILKNLTNQIQEITVSDRYNKALDYSIYIKANGQVEIDHLLTVFNLKTLVEKKILHVEGQILPEPSVMNPQSNVVQDTVKPEDSDNTTPEGSENDVTPEDASTTGDEDTVNDKADETQVDVQDSVTPEDDGIITCSVCGKEFSSPRSLSMHMNKSHKE